MCITVICPSSLVSAPQVRSGSGEAVACSSQASLKKSKHAVAGSHRYATISRSHTNSCSQRNSWGEVVGESKKRENRKGKEKKNPDHNIPVITYKLGSNSVRYSVAVVNSCF